MAFLAARRYATPFANLAVVKRPESAPSHVFSASRRNRSITGISKPYVAAASSLEEARKAVTDHPHEPLVHRYVSE